MRPAHDISLAVFRQTESRFVGARGQFLASAAQNGIGSGLTGLDARIGPLPRGGVTVITGSQGSGKTTLLLYILRHNVVNGARTAVLFTSGYSSAAAIELMACAIADLEIPKLRSGHFSRKKWAELSPAFQSLSSAKLWLEDNGSHVLSAADVAGKVKKLADGLAAEKLKPDMILIDGLENPSGKDGCPASWNETLRGLRTLAKEQNAALIVTLRKEKRRYAASCNHSGDEESADIIMETKIRYFKEGKIKLSVFMTAGQNIGVAEVDYNPLTGKLSD